MTTESRFDDRETLASFLAGSIAQSLTSAATERGAASLVLSGGSTPAPLFAALQTQIVPWEKVAITLADERWVEPSDEASNEGMVRRLLLSEERSRERASWASRTTLRRQKKGPRPEEALGEVVRPFDVVVLGMGEDGHTASLFPAAPELAAGLDLDNPASCLAVRPPKAPQARISLTLRALLDSRRIVLHITGGGKWEVYQKALLEAGPTEELPIRGVLRHADARLEVYWAP